MNSLLLKQNEENTFNLTIIILFFPKVSKLCDNTSEFKV